MRLLRKQLLAEVRKRRVSEIDGKSWLDRALLAYIQAETFGFCGIYVICV